MSSHKDMLSRLGCNHAHVYWFKRNGAVVARQGAYWSDKELYLLAIMQRYGESILVAAYFLMRSTGGIAARREVLKPYMAKPCLHSNAIYTWRYTRHGQHKRY